MKLAIETDVRVIFQLPKKPRKDFQLVQQMKKLASKPLKHDPSIVFHSLENDEDLLYPQYDPFLLKEEDFMPYFLFTLFQNV